MAFTHTEASRAAPVNDKEIHKAYPQIMAEVEWRFNEICGYALSPQA
jgi:hypothetical protein